MSEGKTPTPNPSTGKAVRNLLRGTSVRARAHRGKPHMKFLLPSEMSYDKEYEAFLPLIFLFFL